MEIVILKEQEASVLVAGNGFHFVSRYAGQFITSPYINDAILFPENADLTMVIEDILSRWDVTGLSQVIVTVTTDKNGDYKQKDETQKDFSNNEQNDCPF